MYQWLNGGSIIMIVLDTPTQIEAFRLRTLLKGLKLETMGMKMSRGASCYQIVKEDFGFKGSKEKVYEQFKQLLNKEGLA
jgi:uncharacterized protein (DUF1786 family)